MLSRLHLQVGSVVSRCRRLRLLFAVARAAPGAGCDRQLRRPGRFARHQLGEIFRAAEAFRHLGHDLIVHMQHDRIAGSLEPQHGVSQQITSNAADDVLCPEAAIGAMTVTAILELAGAVIGEHNRLFVLIANNARLRIAELAAARQFQLQESAGASERNRPTVRNAAALAHGSPGRAINLVPEALDGRMRSTPFILECLDFLIGKLIRLEFAPGAKTAGIAKRQITGFADVALRRTLIEAAIAARGRSCRR